MSKEYYDDREGLILLSRNSVFNFVISNRNFGKTWALKKHAIKKGKRSLRESIS